MKKLSCAAPASIFRIARFRCCRWSFPPRSARSSRSVDRLVLSVELEIDRRGDIIAQRFGRGVIRSVERMTYTDVHALLEGDPGVARAVRAADRRVSN